ncbi:hypothetical protein NP493_45g05000 [Ridgeia piscesae]|uniref:alpha-1,2-Mannosidase n=1 Tax=Ridgeia piscesae TaxID=27915 RepID=A0AAD9UJR1_RIDPI|nr:hypothetical protein NP493_45g05000 [Ridgeia piscesae]
MASVLAVDDFVTLYEPLFRGSFRRKCIVLAVILIFMYAIYLVTTLNRQPSNNNGVITQHQLPRQQSLLLKRLLRRRPTQQPTHDSQTKVSDDVDDLNDEKFVEITIRGDTTVKIPSREDSAKDFEIVSKTDGHRPDIKVAAIDDNVRDVEVLSKHDKISVSAKKRKEKDAEIKRKYERMYGKLSGTRDNSDVLSTKDPYRGYQNAGQKAIVDTFMFAWNNYKKYAWGMDELRPVSGRGTNWFGVGLTIVDSLDTLYIMGLKDEFKEARDWVANHLVFNSIKEVSLFEIVIRELGGLLSAYHLSHDRVFLDKAEELAKKLRPCLESKTGIPCASLHLDTATPNFDRTNLASVGSIQLEFRALSRATKNATWERLVDKLNAVLHKLDRVDGLLSTPVDPQYPHTYHGNTVSVGAEGDSFYEYLLKQWLQTGKKKFELKDDFILAMEGIKKHLVKHSKGSNLTFVGKYYTMGMKNFVPEMEHLTCYLPGVLALAYMNGLGVEYLKLGEEIARTCYKMYRQSPMGLSPEVVAINDAADPHKAMEVSTETGYSLLRPEAVESFFILFRATKKKKYRAWGWKIYQAIEKHARVKYGYSSIENVQDVQNTSYLDKMETFFLAETLKYLYLLFNDDPNLLPLDKYVFNTEAHPLPIYTS